jgi:hypothetical protein
MLKVDRLESGTDLTFFYDFSVGFRNCSNSMVSVFFILIGEDPHHHGRTSVGHEVSTSLIDQSKNKTDTQV